jgi:hypothetical protein
MDLGALGRLRHLGGPALELYERLTAAADASADGSPAHMAKAKFEEAWQADPIGTAQRAEQEVE